MPDVKTPLVNNNVNTANTPGFDQASIKRPGLEEPSLKLKKPLLDFGKRSVTGKVIATIFSLLLLLAGIAAGVLLIQQQQEIRERASGNEECINSYLCTFLNEPGNTHTYEARNEISHLLITGRAVYRFEPGVSDDSCFRVTISKNIALWVKYGTGEDCRDVVSVQVWLKE